MELSRSRQTITSECFVITVDAKAMAISPHSLQHPPHAGASDISMEATRRTGRAVDVRDRDCAVERMRARCT